MKLQFEYEKQNEIIDEENFFKENGNLVFDIDSKVQMKVMIKEICAKLQLKDEYLIKKLEMMLKYELPFFTTNRRLVRNWIVKNFIF